MTFAAGMATEGYIPVVAIYSTFLQRGYDEILHDVCLQNLHVVLALDRGGLVGADGPTHHGVFDFAYMRSIPNMVIMAPKDENELQHMLKTAVDHPGPISLRYPRGEGWDVAIDRQSSAAWRSARRNCLRDGNDMVIAAIGQTVIPALKAAQDLAPLGISAAVVNARFVKPLDENLFRDLLTRVPRLITVEDHVISRRLRQRAGGIPRRRWHYRGRSEAARRARSIHSPWHSGRTQENLRLRQRCHRSGGLADDAPRQKEK